MSASSSPTGSSAAAGAGNHYLTPPPPNDYFRDGRIKAAASRLTSYPETGTGFLTPPRIRIRSSSSDENGALHTPPLIQKPDPGLARRLKAATLPRNAPEDLCGKVSEAASVLRSPSGAGRGSSLTPPGTSDDSQVGAGGRIRSSSGPRPLKEAEFPIADFQRALNGNKANFNPLRAILLTHGWTRNDLNYIETKVKLFSSSGKLERDHLIDAIIVMAIQKSDLAVFHAFPYIKEKNRINHFAQIATSAFCEKGDDLAFDVLLIVLKKYRPENTDACIALAFEKVKNNPLLRQRLIHLFPSAFVLSPKASQDEDGKEEMRCKFSVPPRPFPIDDFQKALQNVEFDTLCKILIKHGWERSDLDMVEPWMQQLRLERIKYEKDFVENSSLMNIDDIVQRLLEAAIDNKRQVPFFDFLPRFREPGGAESRADRLGKKIADALEMEPENPLFFDLFVRIMTKFQPPSLHAYVARVHSKLDADKKRFLNSRFLPALD